MALPENVLVWFRTHHGVASRAALLRLGLTEAQIRRLAATGELVVVHEGVYRHAVWPETFMSDCSARCAADSSMVMSCGAAARLWTYRRCTGVGLHTITAATHRPIDGSLVHRTLVLPPSHVHERPDGIRVASPARTVFDLSRHVGPETLESVIEQGLRRSQFDIPTLYAMGRLLCRRGRAGSRLFADVLTSRPAWRRPVDSHPELDLLHALERLGVRLQTQVSLQLADGRTIHPDLGDPVIGFYVEIDDHEWHGGRLASTYDHQRDRSARLVGARVERVSTDEVAERSPRLVRDLVDAYQQQRSSVLRRRSSAS